MHKLSRLKNGLTVIEVPLRGLRSSTLLTMFPVGSRYESKEMSGASHFVEHMLFKGTKKRPQPIDISRALESVGAEYNAFTNKDYTGYYAKIDNAKLEVAFDVISDIVYNSKISEEEMEREKGVICEEIKMYDDNPTMNIDSLFERLMFGDHPLGWDIAGTVESVRNINRENLYNYFLSHYWPNNMVLVIAGGYNRTQLNKCLKYFLDKQGKKQPGYKESYLKYSLSKDNLPAEMRVAVKEKKLDQAHVIYGFPGLAYEDKRCYAAALLLNILGGGMSSRLFMEVREKRGLAYMVRAGSANYRDTGTVYVQAGLDVGRLEEAVKVIKLELTKISQNLVQPHELEEAKNNLIGRLTLAGEDSSTHAEWYSRQFLFFKKIESPFQFSNKLKKVTAKEVLNVAKDLFDFKQARLAVIGPSKKEDVLKML